jgi:hypothetical protein
MTHWNSSPHPISDIRDWEEAGRLELEPDFQRREVWSPSARIMLIDTVLRDIPMPKIFVASSIRDGRTYRVVIDGQQRIRALFAFLRDEFPLDPPYTGAEQGKLFSQLDPLTQNKILSYNIDFNEAVNPTDKEIREVFSRVNKYTVVLNKQELRRADYPGAFLRASEEIALEDFFDRARIFTPADRRRAGDVEYASELLAAMLRGIQDGKSSLDSVYQEFSTWDEADRDETLRQFRTVLAEIDLLFPPSERRPLSETRFRQKADFYTLFVCILDYVRENRTLKGKDLSPLQQDLRDLDEMIRPESDVRICSEYAIKCVSQANSGSSRRWRKQFMSSILDGTFRSAFPQGPSAELYYLILDDCAFDGSGMCPDPEFYCPICDGQIKDVRNARLAWKTSASVYQLDNSFWVGPGCSDKATGFQLLPRRDKDAKAYFPR